MKAPKAFGGEIPGEARAARDRAYKIECCSMGALTAKITSIVKRRFTAFSVAFFIPYRGTRLKAAIRIVGENLPRQFDVAFSSPGQSADRPGGVWTVRMEGSMRCG